LVAKQEVLWIFRQDCEPDTFSGVFHATDHEIMMLFNAMTRPFWLGIPATRRALLSSRTVNQAPFGVVFHATDQGIRGS